MINTAPPNGSEDVSADRIFEGGDGGAVIPGSDTIIYTADYT